MDIYDVILLSDRTEDGIRKASFQTSEMVCSSRIDIELDGDIVRRVQYTDGCHGNTQGVALCAGGVSIEILCGYVLLRLSAPCDVLLRLGVSDADEGAAL